MRIGSLTPCVRRESDGMNENKRVFPCLTVAAIANEYERKVEEVVLARFTDQNRVVILLSTSKYTKARKRRRNTFLSMPLVLALDQSERRYPFPRCHRWS